MNAPPPGCPRCGQPLGRDGLCAACSVGRSSIGGKTMMVPVQPAGAGVASVPAGDDLGRVPLPAGWEIVLDVVDGPGTGQSFRVTQSRVLIGRADVEVPLGGDPRVSRRHASLEVYGAACVLLKDLGSTNGTLVNGRRVTAAELQDGDEIQTGDTRLLVTIGMPPR